MEAIRLWKLYVIMQAGFIKCITTDQLVSRLALILSTLERENSGQADVEKLVYVSDDMETELTPDEKRRRIKRMPDGCKEM